MPKRTGKALTQKEAQFVTGVAQGKTQTQAALEAGYSPQTAQKVAYQILRRPSVCSAFTEAVERTGITWSDIVKPVVEALQATIYIRRRANLIDTGIPDHKTRQDAHDRLVALYGGIPRAVEMPPPQRPPLMVVIARDKDKNTLTVPETATSTGGSSPPAVKPVTIVATFHREE
jgi:terminase small subunit-like protein